jgi:hypothetical protein
VVLASAVLGVAVFLLVKDSLTDDAYITLSYAKNLALSGEWALVPGMPANSATSPLNVGLLGGITALTRLSGGPHPVLALGALTVVTAAALGWGWARLARAFGFGIGVGLIGTAVVLLNPFLLSAMGLEVLLVPAVLVWLVVCATERRPVPYGVVSGVALLTRLDLVLFVVVIALCTPALRRALGRAVLAAVVVAGPWYLFSWIVFGSAVPDTLLIKRTQDGLFGPWSYFTGPVMYYLGRSIVVLLSFGPAVVGLVAWFTLLAARSAARWRDFPAVGPLLGLGAGGIAYYGVYSLLGVGPYHWYFVPPIVSLGMFAVAAFGLWLARTRSHRELLARGPLTALGVVVALLLGVVAVDVKQGVPWPSPVIFGNWASARDYARVGTALGDRVGEATVRAPGEIGTLAYFCECRIVDVFSDRGQVADLLRRRIARAGPVTEALLRVNYLWFDDTREPQPLDYRLVYGEGPGEGTDTWPVHSAAKGTGHFALRPVPGT